MPTVALDCEIIYSILHDDPSDKAGAYGVQDAGGALIQAIAGDYYTVMGLPLHALTQKLLKNDYAYGEK